jgi:hypothetical protein
MAITENTGEEWRNPLLGRLVRVNGKAVMRQPNSEYVFPNNGVEENDETANMDTVRWRAPSCVGEDGEKFHAIITHVVYIDETFTGLVELTLHAPGKFRDWRHAKKHLSATRWKRPQGFVAWVAVGELEESGDLVYVDEFPPPPQQQRRTPTCYASAKLKCLRAEEAAAEAEAAEAAAAEAAAEERKRKQAEERKRKRETRAQEPAEALVQLFLGGDLNHQCDLPWEVMEGPRSRWKLNNKLPPKKRLSREVY